MQYLIKKEEIQCEIDERSKVPPSHFFSDQ
jgi:hypothetical protein